MKRLFILASAAALMLASCAKTTVVYNEAPEEIGFKAVTGVMTKAHVEWNQETSKLGVFAIYQDNNLYLENKAFEKHTTESYFVGEEKSYYWPIGESLDFVVYAPHTNGVTYNGTTEVLTWTVNNSATDQTDVLYGGKKLTLAKQSNAMEMPLKHALAQVVVNIKADQADVVTVNSLTLNNIYVNETLTINYTNPESPVITWTTNNSTSRTLFTDLPLTTTDSNTNCFIVPASQTQLNLNYTLAGNATPINYPIDLTGYGNWEAGKKYVYNIEVSASEIKFNPVPAEWITDLDDDPETNDAFNVPPVNQTV